MPGTNNNYKNSFWPAGNTPGYCFMSASTTPLNWSKPFSIGKLWIYGITGGRRQLCIARKSRSSMLWHCGFFPRPWRSGGLVCKLRAVLKFKCKIDPCHRNEARELQMRHDRNVKKIYFVLWRKRLQKSRVRLESFPYTLQTMTRMDDVS